MKLYRCKMCNIIITIQELSPSDNYNERYCKACKEFFNQFLKKAKELKTCQ